MACCRGNEKDFDRDFPERSSVYCPRERSRIYLKLEFNSSIAARDESADSTIRGVEMVLGILQSSRMQDLGTGLVRVSVLVRIDTTRVTPSDPGYILTMRPNFHRNGGRFFSFSTTITSKNLQY